MASAITNAAVLATAGVGHVDSLCLEPELASGIGQPDVDLRLASSEDAAALAALNVAAWRTAYAAFLPADFLASLQAADWEERFRGRLSDTAQHGFILAASDEHGLLGYVWAGASRARELMAVAEIYAIYVVPSAAGTGVGSALLANAETTLARVGHQRAMLWVFARNREARRFYEHRGWRLDGRRKLWQRDQVRRLLVCYRKTLSLA